MIHLDREETVRFLRDLVRENTSNPPGNEARLARLVGEKMAQLGLKVSVEPLGDGRANVIGVLPGERQSEALLYCGHLDTVPPGSAGWQHDPFGAEVVAGRMYGRGTVDMKSGLAAMVMAAGALSREGTGLGGDLIVLGTAGEEVDLMGARTFAQEGGLENVCGIVIGEPTNLELVTAHRGALWLRICTFGRSAHGAMPEEGVSAITHMCALLSKLSEHQFSYQEHPLLGTPSMNVGTIAGGTKVNMVPDLCTITLDVRTLPDQRREDVLSEFRAILDQLKSALRGFRASIEIIGDRPAIETSPEERLVAVAIQVARTVLKRELTPAGVSYYTDASELAASGEIPVIILGPGDERMAHRPDEWVELEQVHSATRFYAALAREILKPGGALSP